MQQITPRTNQELIDLVLAVDTMSIPNRKNIMDICFPVFFAYYYNDYIRSPFSEDHFVVFKDLADLTEGNIDTYMLFTYRGFAKTSIFRGYLTWLLVTGQKKYINIDSYDGANAKNTIAQQQYYLTNNKKLLTDFNDGKSYIQQKNITADTKATAKEFVTTTGSKMEAFSVGQSVRGRIMSDGTRPQILFFDDIENEITIQSEVMVEKIIHHIDSAFTATDMQDTAPTLIAGNHISSTGVVQHLIDMSEGKSNMRVRDISIYDNQGNIRWDRYTAEALQSIKDKIGELSFLEEYCGQPRDLTTAEIKKDWIRYEKRSILDTFLHTTYMAVDTALSDNETDDDTAITVAHMDGLGNSYIEPLFIHQDTNEVIEELFRLYIRHYPQVILIEKTPQSGTLKHVLEKEMLLRKITLPIIWIPHSTDKNIRIRAALQPKYKSSKIVHLLNEDDTKSEGLEKYERQILRFPNGLHDDGPDSHAMIYEIPQVSGNILRNTRQGNNIPSLISFK